ncbi:MAG TPA: hypothetical protein VH575_14445 [Gemmataceae bacterium]|jgi:hypothetical protein
MADPPTPASGESAAGKGGIHASPHEATFKPAREKGASSPLELGAEAGEAGAGHHTGPGQYGLQDVGPFKPTFSDGRDKGSRASRK